MRFKIISAGWQCADWMGQTLKSVEAQSLKNWDIGIAYDPSSDNGSDIIREWCSIDPEHRKFTINSEKKFAIRNHYETIKNLDVQDDDVIIFLDLDGDQFAHPKVLERLQEAYKAGFLVTFGQYRPVPDMGTSGPAQRYPIKVVRQNSYRDYHRKGGAGFNHPRTMSGRIFNAIPEAMFKWQHAGSKTLPNRKEKFVWRAGDFYEGSTDYVFMVSALELAGGNYKCFDEVLLLYNHANPLADNKTHPQQAHICLLDFYSRPPLSPLSKGNPIVNVEERQEVFLSADERREVLRKYGLKHKLNTLVETGTNDGGTPWALKDSFAKIYTIELSQPAWQAAVKRFRNIPRIHCLLGDSAIVLPEVLKNLKSPALFWLDGHASGGITARGDKDTPVLDELAAIFATKIPHVILVDDARLFEGMSCYGEWPDWPHIDVVAKMAEDNGYKFEILDDIIRLTP